MSRLNQLGKHSIVEGSLLSWMLARKLKMMVVIALTNKMARQMWAIMMKTRISVLWPC